MSIHDALRSEPAADARRTRPSHPKGFEPGVTFSVDSGLPESAVIASFVEIDAEDHRARIEEQTGLRIPAGLDVRLERLTLQNGAGQAACGAPELHPAHTFEDLDDAPTECDGVPIARAERWWYKYLFVARPSETSAEAFDHVATLKALRRNRKAVKPRHTGPSTFGLSWNDWQGGKGEGGGTPALLARFDEQVEGAKARIAELRRIHRDLGRLFIIGGGDMVEGCTIYPHQMLHVDADRRAQVNIVTDMILYGLDELAPLFEEVQLLVVGGNHGENRIDGNRTGRTDNDDCLVFENAARATARDPRLQHVSYAIAQGEPAKTLDVNGWIYGTTHGQAFGKGAGRPEQKAHNWFKGQAAGRFPVGDADVLVTHHYHHKAERDWGACLWVQTPANDGGSLQHTDLTGEAADAGMLSWVVTDACRYQDAQIL